MIEPFHKTFRDIEGDYASVCWVTRLQNSVMLEAGAYDDSEEGARCVQLALEPSVARSLAQALIDGAKLAESSQTP